MGQSISAYLKSAGEVRSVRQIYAVATAICEDPDASPHLRVTSSALIRKLDQIISLPIASAPFLASIWRDFRDLSALLERDYSKLSLIPVIGPVREPAHVVAGPETRNNRAVTAYVEP